jgi:hypothetical protein
MNECPFPKKARKNLDSMNKLNVVTLAPLLSSKQNNGHVYWFHSTLHETFLLNTEANHITLCPIENSPDWGIGTFSVSAQRRQRLSHFPLFGLKIDILDSEANIRKHFGPNSQVHLHVYDGGFREYILVSELLERNSSWTSSFNFAGWLDPWVKYLEKDDKKIESKENQIGELEFNNPRILKYTETRALAELFIGVRLEPETYPSFSTLAIFQKQIATTKKTTDVSFFPESEEELDFCIAVSKRVNIATQGRVSFALQPRWKLALSEIRIKELEALSFKVFAANLMLDEYSDMFSESQVVVLPYRRGDFYKLQSSGRLLDALTSNCKVVVPSGTALEEACLSNKEVVASNMMDPEDTSAKILHLLLQRVSPKTLVYSPANSVNRIIHDARSLGSLDRSTSGFSFDSCQRQRLAFGYLRLDWYQPFIGVLKALNFPNELLVKIRSRLGRRA